MENTPFIHIENLSYAYVGEDQKPIPVLKDLSLDIREGEYVVVLGHNGSGKSTLAKLLNMVIDDYTFAEGKITVDGMDVMSPDLTDEGVLTLRKNVGMVFQNPDNQLVATVVEEDVAFGPENLGIPQPELRARVDEALATVGMSAYAHHEPHRLSGGQKQRVAIAGIIAMKPEVLVLDEPAAGLDPVGRDSIFESIMRYRRETGATVVIVSHSMEDMARLCDELIVMARAKVVMQGNCAEIFSRAEELEEIGLAVPQITLLMHELNARGIKVNNGIYTEEAAVKEIAALLKGKK